MVDGERRVNFATPQADAHIRGIDTWWRANLAALDLFLRRMDSLAQQLQPIVAMRVQ
jgi:hypothetical protein